MEAAAQFVVESPDVVYSPEAIEAQYEYRTTSVSREDGVLKVGRGPGAQRARSGRDCPTSAAPGSLDPARPQVHPSATRFTFRTARQVPRLGVMLVGWGGNNGSTLTAAVLANRLRLSWPTRTGRKVGVGWSPGQEIGSERMGPRGGASAGRGLPGAEPEGVTGSGEAPPAGE